MTPGVYQILCVPTNTVYIGITQNLLERFGKHSATLANNRHDCAALQEDCNRLGQDNFTFTTICSGPEWPNQKDRELTENSVIRQKIEESYNVYNTDLNAPFSRNYKRSISIDGKIFNNYKEIIAAGLANNDGTPKEATKIKKFPELG